MAVQAVGLLTDSFQAQIDDLLRRVGISVQLDETRYRLADESYRAVAKYLESQPRVRLLNPAMYPQGSMRLNTTVKPLGGDEYDLDFVCEFGRPAYYFSHPVDALHLLENALRESATYAPMVERKNRCVRLNYSHRFHMDILPACHDQQNGGTCIVVPDRELGQWTASNPKGYALWFEQRGRQFALDQLMEKAEPIPIQEPGEIKAPIRLCAQLLKRSRDVRFRDRDEIAPASVVLTTLVGRIYRGEQSVSRAVQKILSGIVELVQSNYPSRLVVLNPTNADEDLSERWDKNPRAYQEFVKYVADFGDQWRALMQTRGIEKISKILELLFGEQLTKQVVESYTKDVESLRSKRALGIQKSAGILTSVVSSSVVPVRPNTFFGDAE